MKNQIFTCLFMLLLVVPAFAQNSGKGFNYQAIARNQNGQVIQNQTVILRFSLIRQNETAPTWQEIQAAITDEFGAFSLTIGSGQRTDGTVAQYNQVNFTGLPFWLKVELNDDEDYFEISFRELMSVPYAEVAFNATPFLPGMMIPFAGPQENIPEGWLLCDGSLKNINDYPNLYLAIGKAWGGNSSQFNLPDCRGNFLRGVSYASNRDEDKTSRTALYAGGNTGNFVGSYQPSVFSSHNHSGATSSDGGHSHVVKNGSTSILWGDGGGATSNYIDSGGGAGGYGGSVTAAAVGSHDHTISSNGGNETRPENIYVNYIIKY